MCMIVSKCVRITQQEGPRNDNPHWELVRNGKFHTSFHSNFIGRCFPWSIQVTLLCESGMASSSKRKSRRDYDWYGVEIFKTGLIPQPRNPYFVTKKRRQRAGELVSTYKHTTYYLSILIKKLQFFDHHVTAAMIVYTHGCDQMLQPQTP